MTKRTEIEKIKYRIENLPGEIWKPIPMLFNLYSASNHGRIKRDLQERDYGNGANPRLFPEQLIKPDLKPNGYLEIKVSIHGKTIKKYVHQLVADAFDLPYTAPNQTDINHKNGDRADNRLENIERCTREYNLNYGDHNAKVSESLKRYYAELKRA